MFKLKVIRIGNSLGVILPRQLIARLKLMVGDEMCLTDAVKGYHLTPASRTRGDQMEAARNILKRRRAVLRELAK